MAINKRGDKYVLDWWNDGRRLRKFFTTKREAENYRATVRTQQKSGTFTAPDRIPLFHEAAAAWLTTRRDRSEGAYAAYHGYINRHLVPQFGNRRLDRIAPEDISAWRAKLAESGIGSAWRRPMAPRSIANIVRTLSSIFEMAIRNGRIFSNPCKRLERQYSRARVDGRDDGAIRATEILNPGEIRRLIEAAQPGLERTLFTLAAATGMRSGELLALSWKGISFDGQPQISIGRSLSWAKGPADQKPMPRFGPPKTKAGERDISIDAPMLLVLKQWKLRSGHTNPDDLVFGQPDGQPIRRSVLLRDKFWPALKRAGLRHTTFHSLRHSYASGLIQRGSPITEVQAKLGHSNPSITLKVYSHWFKGSDSGASSAYNAAIFSAEDTIDTKPTPNRPSTAKNL